MNDPTIILKKPIAWLHLAEVTFSQPFNPEQRFKQYNSFNNAIHNAKRGMVAIGEGAGVLAERTFALHVGSFATIKTTMLQSVFLSVYGVFCALLMFTPVPSAFFCFLNLLVCVTVSGCLTATGWLIP